MRRRFGNLIRKRYKPHNLNGLSGLARVLAAGGPAVRKIAIDGFRAIADWPADAREFFEEGKLPCVLQLDKRAAWHGQLVEQLVDGIDGECLSYQRIAKLSATPAARPTTFDVHVVPVMCQRHG